MKTKRKKALIEKYGHGKTMPACREVELRKKRMIIANRSFCALYPIIIPGLRAEEE